MITSSEILIMLKTRYGVHSTRKLANCLGLSQGLIQRHYKGESLSISNALRFADELGLDRYEVLISNLCEKNLIPQEAKEMLAATIGADLRLKPDKLTTLLASDHNNVTTQSNTV